MPSSSRVWVYQSDREFTAQESAAIAAELTAFVSQWAAHKAKVMGEGLVLFGRFVILAADEQMVQVSGCSIDSTVHFIKELGAKYKVNFFDRFYTCYRDGAQVLGCDIPTFKERMADGSVTDETIVFNNTITTIGDLNTKWQKPLVQSWQKTYELPLAGLRL